MPLGQKPPHMRKRTLACAAITALLVLSALVVSFFINYVPPNQNQKEQKPFYVGVTFCGNTTSEAKALVDRVRNCTNLFVLQSGPLQENVDAINEICDYAVASGLHVIVYFGSYGSNRIAISSFLNSSANRWGDYFLGLYYGDEPGGKMLDATNVELYDPKTGYTVSKGSGGGATVRNSSLSQIDFAPSGQITMFNVDFTTQAKPKFTTLNYYTNGSVVKQTNDGTWMYETNGTVTLRQPNGTLTTVTDAGDISQFEPYEKVWNMRPFQSYDEAANRFVVHYQNALGWLHNQSSVRAFTSDYGLYWFDYLGGYDVVLAELGRNHTSSQDIALVRGAANMQNRSWGAMITWKYTELPYLASGNEIYDQMRAAYENGAEYVVLFNYPMIEGNPYGALREEHFNALERFWSEVVQDPRVVNGGVEAEAALILPKNYGGGVRGPNDNIWGIWQPDGTSQQIWTLLQSKLQQYGSKLDIIYDDPTYHATKEYAQIYYWNQTALP